MYITINTGASLQRLLRRIGAGRIDGGAGSSARQTSVGGQEELAAYVSRHLVPVGRLDDAHADINTPDNTTTGYLGGLAMSGPMADRL